MFKTTLILLLQVVLINTYCQDNVYTPKGAQVDVVYIAGEWEDSIRHKFDSIAMALYPNATKINTYVGYSTTKLFNCHGYAWHVSEGGAYVWIGWEPYNMD
ncbi:MAG: hypothetical protein P1P86_16595, partial [Bacteroidales bacterium]|nr:hypothetical protein [Bacteroidales bacterium]